MFIRRPFRPVVGGLVVAVVVIDIRSTGNWGLQVVVIRYYKLLGVATSSIYSSGVFYGAAKRTRRP